MSYSRNYFLERFREVEKLKKEIKSEEDHPDMEAYKKRRLQLANLFLELGERDNAKTIEESLAKRVKLAMHKPVFDLEMAENVAILANTLLDEEKFDKAEDYIRMIEEHCYDYNVFILYLKLKKDILTSNVDDATKANLFRLEEKTENKEAKGFSFDFEVLTKELRALYLFENNQFQDAIEKFEEAYNLAKKKEIARYEYRLLFRLSRAYEKINDYKTATQIYAQYRKETDEFYKNKEYAYSDFLMEIYGIKKKAKQSTALKVMEDATTLVYNRNFLHELIEGFFIEGGASSMCAVMFNVDSFKRFFNEKGGDNEEFLAKVGKALLKIKADDIMPIRYGEDDFLIILRDVEEESGVAVAKNILKNLERFLLTKNDNADAKDAEILKKTEVDVVENMTLNAGIAAKRCENKSDMIRLIEMAKKTLEMSLKYGQNEWERFYVVAYVD